MKILNLLKSKTGKLVLGGTQLAVLTVGAAGLFSSAMFSVGTKQGEVLATRSLSSVSNSYNYEGLNRRADGMLSSMNIQNRDGKKGVAVGADRERLEGYRSKNDFGLSAIDNLENNISIPGVGSAASSSETDGLGSGGVDMVEVNAGNYAFRSSGANVSASAVAQGSTGSPTGTSAGGQLASASMARASGNTFNATSGSMGGGNSSGSSNSRSARSSSEGGRSEGYNFSGTMPSGSSAVDLQSAALASAKGKSSGFMAGGRNGKAGKGYRSLRDRDNDLKDISKRSADAARNSTRSSNEGARAFLASSQNSGGMSIEAGTEGTTTGSADFTTPTDRNLKAIGDWGNKEDATAKERSKDRNNLIKLLMGAFFATVVAIPFGYMLISKGKGGGLAGIFMIIAGCALIAAAIAVSLWAVVAAGMFAGKWGGGFLSTLTGILGGVCTAALGLTIAAAFSGQKSPLTKFFNKFIPGAKKLAISQMLSKGQELVSNEINKEVQKDAQKDAKKK